MSFVLRTYYKAKYTLLRPGNGNYSFAFVPRTRTFGDDKAEKDPEYSSSTILVENSFNVQELPVIIRRVKDLYLPEEKPKNEDQKHTDSLNYHLIQGEFKECLALRDVFSLLSKCSKITPNIALGAMERIYDLEKNPHVLDKTSNNINVAKDAIVDKLLKVVMKTEETQTILNALNSVSSFIDPYKYKFCDEILLRVFDNKLSIEQLCTFMEFLVKNKSDPKYSALIDKLWVGFFEREKDINGNNIVTIFQLLPNLRDSKRTVLNLLEQKLSELWCRIDSPGMQEILNTFIYEKFWCPQSFAVAGGWLQSNIHAIDEDSLLDIITKFTRLKYNDKQIEKSVERYVRLKGSKISSPILIVGILNYCMQFHIRSNHILNGCCDYFLAKGSTVPYSFVKYIVYPYGFLQYSPVNNEEFWAAVENFVRENLDKMTINDVSSIILSFIYAGKHPLELVNKIFSAEYLSRINHGDPEMRRLHLIDTALSLESREYMGPLLPKDQWSKEITQDGRVKKLVSNIHDTLTTIAGGVDKMSTSVIIPNLHSDETYFIDVMLHPVGLGSTTFNWKLKSAKDENIALLIHLPEHYCSDDTQLVGPQEMRRKHLRLLGMRVVSLKYTTLYKYQNNRNKKALEKYLSDSCTDADVSL